MRDLPRGWKSVPLREVAAGGVFADGDWVESKDQDPNGGVRLIQLADIGVGRFLDKSSRFLTESKAAELGCTFLEPGDVLVSRMADPIGRACVFPSVSQRSVTVVDVCIVRPRPEFTDNRWLTATINSPQFRGAVELAASGTTRSRVSRGNLGNLELPVPPLNEQRRIVAKLEALQTRSRRAREALDAVPPLLEKLRQSILAAAFRGDLTKDWRAKNKDVEPASKLLERIRAERRKKWEEAELAKLKAKGKPPADDKWKWKYKEPEPVDTTGLPELPEGWCWARADEVCSHVVDCHNKTAPYVPDGIPLVRTTNIRDGRINLTDSKFVDESTYAFWSRRCPPAPGDVIFTREAPMGEAGMVPDGTRLCMGQRMMLLRSDGELLRRRFLLFAVQAPHVAAYADRLSVGSGVRHLRVGDVEALPLPLAPAAEQRAVEEAIENAVQRHSVVAASSAKLQLALQGLERAILAKAFRGELVPQDPNDESAEAMLARWGGEAYGANARSKEATMTTAKRRRTSKRGHSSEEAT